MVTDVKPTGRATAAAVEFLQDYRATQRAIRDGADRTMGGEGPIAPISSIQQWLEVHRMKETQVDKPFGIQGSNHDVRGNGKRSSRERQSEIDSSNHHRGRKNFQGKTIPNTHLYGTSLIHQATA